MVGKREMAMMSENAVQENKRARVKTEPYAEFVPDKFLRKFFRANDESNLYCAPSQDIARTLIKEELQSKAPLIVGIYMHCVSLVEDFCKATSLQALVQNLRQYENAKKGLKLFNDTIERNGQKIMDLDYRAVHGKHMRLNKSNEGERNPAVEIAALVKEHGQRHFEKEMHEALEETVETRAMLRKTGTSVQGIQATHHALVQNVAHAVGNLDELIFENGAQDVLAKIQQVERSFSRMCEALQNLKTVMQQAVQEQSVFAPCIFEVGMCALREDDAALGQVLLKKKLRVLCSYLRVYRKRHPAIEDDTPSVFVLHDFKDPLFGLVLTQLGVVCDEEEIAAARRACHPMLNALR